MDENGKINGMTPVLNDILAFVSSKIKYSDIQPMVDVISNFYLTEDLKEAWGMLHPLVDPSGERQLA